MAGIVLSLGSINADFQLRVERRPEISETVVGRDFQRLAGGKAANVAICARRFGQAARLFGHVGDDDLAEQALAPLRDAGVDLEQVKRVPGQATGVAMISVPPDGNKGIILATNANECWQPEDIQAMAKTVEAAPEGSVLVLDCEVPRAAVDAAIAAARRRGLLVVLDPSPAERVDNELLGSVDVITPNAAEAGQILGMECGDPDSAQRAGHALRERGVGSACMKLPEGGCVLVTAEGDCRIDPLGVEVVDTTGAGDAFAGALAASLVAGKDLAEATALAVAASHLTVCGFGSQAPLPELAQAEQMAARLRRHSL